MHQRTNKLHHEVVRLQRDMRSANLMCLLYASRADGRKRATESLLHRAISELRVQTATSLEKVAPVARALRAVIRREGDPSLQATAMSKAVSSLHAEGNDTPGHPKCLREELIALIPELTLLSKESD